MEETLHLSFGIGSISEGPEFYESYAWQHSLTLNSLLKKYFPAPRREAGAHATINLHCAGRFNVELRTDIGDAKLNVRRREIEVSISIALAEFAPGQEHKFRETFTGLLDTAIERIAAHKDCAKIGIDPIWLRQTWQKVIDNYLALELPLVPSTPPNETEMPPSSNAEYYFEFEQKKDLLAFNKALKVRNLRADWDDESEDGYYVVVEDPNSPKLNKQFEQELIVLAEDHNGIYDGWAAL